jgi:hypothetical protein
MLKFIAYFLVASLYATSMHADLRPVIFVGYNIEDGDFEGSRSAAIIGIGLESEISKSLLVGGDYMVSLQDHPSNPGRVSYLEGGLFCRFPVSSIFSPRIGGGMGLAFDSRGDEVVTGLWFFDIGMEISTRNAILETVSFQYRANSFEAANVHRLFVGLGF